MRSHIMLKRNMSHWKDIKLAPPDKILGLTEAFKADSFKHKINLGVGAYRSDDGTPLVLPSVRIAEQRIFEKKLDKEYAPIAGVQSFINHSLEFGYGMKADIITQGQVAAVQTISGTGGCRLAGEFIKKFHGAGRSLFVPNPTWGNHLAIFENAGLKPQYYPYYDSATNTVDFKNLLEFIHKQTTKEAYMFHACAHNPTGCDLTPEQWKELSILLKKKDHLLFFDCAYQGFASGDAEKDAFAIRQFVADGHRIILCQSYAKNFGLYGERAGVLSVVTDSKEETERVNSQLKVIIRPMYSNPPIHGARIIAEVLGDPVLRQQWTLECKAMADRINSMRILLREKLEAGTGRSWQHITDQIGMFCYTGLTKEQVGKLRDSYHIYCTEDGRFSVAGINSKNIDYLAQSVIAVLKK